ncbi:MAG: PAS domain S-box protein, partial [Campylobacteraceae bacterium]|nr:PAS domain S-box protein [Campylobacteraceae bacterium]
MDFFKEKSKENKKIIGSWKILVADDEEAVHALTKTVLADFTYGNKTLEILSAYSGKESLELLSSNDDIVLVLLDVVMESDDAGLIVVKKLREELNNNLTQVILRTGHAGKAPELEIVKNYAINDYNEKTELTSQKLFTAIITAIRSYENLTSLESHQHKINALNKDLNKSFQSFNKSVMAAKADEHDTIIYVSDAFCNVTGYTKDELLHNKLAMVRHPNIDKKVLDELEISYTQHKPWIGELQYISKDKKTLWVHANRFPEFDSNGKLLHFMTIFEDITHKKEVESLNSEMERLLSVFDENVIASKTDIHGKIIYISQAFCKVSGFSKEELLGEKHHKIKKMDNTCHNYDEILATISSKKVWKGEIQEENKDGSCYWLQSIITPEYDSNGNFVCYTSISEDITHKKEIEEAKKEIELLNLEIEDT